MFVSGKEEPTVNNGSLHQRKIHTNELIMDASAGIPVNRYSFVGKGFDTSEQMPILLDTIFSQCQNRACIVLSWLASIPGKSAIASKVIESKYLKKGWMVYSRPRYYVAAKLLANNDLMHWPPLEINPMDGGWIIFLGSHGINEVIGLLDEDDILFLARYKYFSPTVNFLRALSITNSSILYQVNDDLNNVGIVIVGEWKLDIEAIACRLDISNVYSGDDAYKVFI